MAGGACLEHHEHHPHAGGNVGLCSLYENENHFPMLYLFIIYSLWSSFLVFVRSSSRFYQILSNFEMNGFRKEIKPECEITFVCNIYQQAYLIALQLARLISADYLDSRNTLEW